MEAANTNTSESSPFLWCELDSWMLVSDPLDLFTFASRFFPLNYDPYVDFSAVLQASIAAEFKEAPMDDLSKDGDSF